MANFDTQGAEFNPTLRMLETSDPCHASTFNRVLGQLIGNDVALEKLISAGDATGAVKINGAEEASGVYAHAAGLSAKATADHAIAIGHRAEASGSSSVAIGEIVEASGSRAMALGSNCSATAPGAIAIGTTVQANNWNSVAIGIGLISNYAYQYVRGKYNATGDYAEIVGNGASTNTRSNAYALTWDGDAEYQLKSSEALYTALNSLGKLSDVYSGGMFSLKSMLGLLLSGLAAQTATAVKNSDVSAAGACTLIKIGNIVIANFRIAYTSGTDTIPTDTTLYTVPTGYKPLTAALCNVTVIRGTSLQAFGGSVTVGTDGTIKHAHGSSVTSLNGTLVWITGM